MKPQADRYFSTSLQLRESGRTVTTHARSARLTAGWAGAVVAHLWAGERVVG